MKYYAYYETVSSFSIMGKAEYDEIMADPEEYNKEHYRINMLEFENLKQAKDHILGHLRGDMEEIKNSIANVHAIRVKKISK